jgi:LPS sulfotransferase NodH
MSIHRYRLSLRMTRIDLGLETGRDDSTRFIVLARSRTGSNLVIHSLMSHPHALACGEIFCDDETCHIHPYPIFPWTIWYRNRFPVRFMRRRFFRPMPPWIDAVGFKLFYNQCRSERNQSVWSFLQQQDDLRVVHLKRRNILRTHLSLHKAIQTDHWIQLQDGDHDRATVRLDPERCEQVFVETRNHERAMDAFFSHQPKLELHYEDLGERYVDQMRRVCDFLGLDSTTEPPPTRQQASMRLSEAIENYAELERRFRGTEWEPFFEE